MPDRTTHAFVGAALGAGAAGLRVSDIPQSQAIPEVIGGVIGGLLGGILPDVLEPATSPNHRQIAHSLVAAGGLGLTRVAEWQAACRSRADAVGQRAVLLPLGCAERNEAAFTAALWRLLAGVIVGLAIGYASHLALDACTSCGLPFLGDWE
jgi:membrane-bound metal-dependent hydrolase YbcI (DUF457 family)